MNSLKCAVSGCLNSDRKSEFVICQGSCQQIFHGVCIGLERSWISSKLKENYVCDKCIASQVVLRNANAHIISHLDKLSETSNSIINKASKSLNANFEMMENFCQRADDTASTKNKLTRDDYDNIKQSVSDLLDVDRGRYLMSDKECVKLLVNHMDKLNHEMTNIMSECLNKVEVISSEVSELKSSVDRLNLIAIDSIASLSHSCENSIMITRNDYNLMMRAINKIAARLDNHDSFKSNIGSSSVLPNHGHGSSLKDELDSASVPISPPISSWEKHSSAHIYSILHAIMLH
jgi:hypothetical protein